MCRLKSMWLVLILALGCISSAVAQETNRLYIEEATIARGCEGTLSVFMENKEPITAVEFTLSVPSGFSINPVSAVLSERGKNHTITARRLSNGNYKFMILSSANNPISGIAGRLFTMRISTPDNVDDNIEYPLTMTQSVMAAPSGQNVIDSAISGSVKIKSMPNLHVISLDCSNPVAGSEMNVKWTVRNDGRGSTETTRWTDYIWMVPNISVGTSMTGSKLLASVDNVSALNPGESYENSVNVRLDERTYGNYDIVVTSDMNGVSGIDFSPCGGTPPIPYLPESSSYGFLMGTAPANSSKVEEENEYNSKSDNFFYTRIDIQIPPLPDLQVPNVVASVDNTEDYAGQNQQPSPLVVAGLGNSTTFYSGKKIKVTATIKNGGGAPFNDKSIKNELYLSNSPDFNGSRVYRFDSNNVTLSLGKDETSDVTFSGYLPYDWYGDTYFIVKVDVDDNVYELANTANNIGVSSKINTLLTPGADFEPYKMSVPNKITSASNFDLGYSVRNIGPGVPFSNNWTDKVYISEKGTGIDNSAKLITSFANKGYYKYDGPMAARIAGVVPGGSSNVGKYVYEGDTYSNKNSIKLPTLPSGKYYIYVVVDAEDKVYEYDGEENNTIISQEIDIVTPDLKCELVSISNDSIQTSDKIAVAWKVMNVGDTDISNVNLSDRIFASSSASGSNPVTLFDASNAVSLASGAEKLLRANITIPKNQYLNGDMYVFVKTNQNGSVPESSSTNNISNPLAAKFKYIADNTAINNNVDGTNLAIGNVLVQDNTSIGSELPISFVIKNNGTKAVTNAVSYTVEFSKDKNYNGNTTKCAFVDSPTNTISLAKGETLTINSKVVVPANMQGGQNYIRISFSCPGLTEQNTADNIYSTPIYIEGNLASLNVSDLNTPNELKTSEQFQISYNVSNLGGWSSRNAIVTLYLSKDNVISSDDVTLVQQTINAVGKSEKKSYSTNLTLNDNQYGAYYLIARITSNYAEELSSETITSKQINVTRSPLPDLNIDDLSQVEVWRSGGIGTVNTLVKNIGDAPTRKDKWTDVFYLSQDYNLDINTAIKLGSKTHVGILNQGESYESKVEFNIPQNVHGYYVLYAVVDGTQSLIEKGRDNNITKTTIHIEDASDTPADLKIEKIYAPTKVVAGEEIAISYSIANNGEYAASGTLRDVLYLSKDNIWDENDLMIGYATGEFNLEAGDVTERSVTGRISNISEGQYYLIVKTNSTRTIAESDYENNLFVMPSALLIDFARLSLGGSMPVNVSGLYKLDVNNGMNGKTLGITLDHSGDATAGIYASFESVPSTAKYEFSSAHLQTEQQEILIPDAQEGTYYILAQDNSAMGRNLNEFIVDGTHAMSRSIMNLSAREVHFGATKLAIKEGGINGRLSTDIQGALLDSIMDFRLTNGSVVIPAESITFKGQTASKATFYLGNAEVGQYDVVSELPNGTLATLPSHFTVVPSTNVNLGVKLDAPKVVRVGTYAPVSVTYVNSGKNDITISEIWLVADGALLSETIEGFDKNPSSELHIKPNIDSDKFGYVTIPPGKQETRNYYLKQLQGTSHLKIYIVK